MKPYKHKKLTDSPDIADIKSEGRASHVGKFAGKGGDFRPYCAPVAKAKTRRNLKRADKARTDRQIREDLRDA